MATNQRLLAMFTGLVILTLVSCRLGEENSSNGPSTNQLESTQVQQLESFSNPWVDQDVALAFEYAMSTLADYGERNDNLSAIAKLNAYKFNAQLRGYEDSDELLRQALDTFDPTVASADQKVIFFSALVEIQRRLQFLSTDSENYYLPLLAALKECSSKEIALECLIRFSLDNNSNYPNEISIEWLLAEVSRLSEELNSDRGQFAKSFLESRQENSKRKQSPKSYSKSRHVETLHASLRIAESCFENRLILLAHREIAFWAINDGAPEKARRHLESWIEYASLLGDPCLHLDGMNSLATLLQQQQQVADAVHVIENARSSQSFSFAASYQQRGLNRTGLAVYQEMEIPDKIVEFETLASQSDDDFQLAATRYELVGTKHDLASSNYHLRDESKLKSNLEVELEKNRSLTGRWLFLTALFLSASLAVAFLTRHSNKVKTLKHLELKEEERFKLQNKVSHMRKMDSLGMLAGGIAHDLNNILVGVMSNAEVIKLRSGGNKFIDQRTQQIIDAAEKASLLSKQMLAYAGKQNVQKIALDLNLLVSNLTSTINKNSTDQIQILLTNQPLIVAADKSQIEKVITNLVTNSIQASSKNSPIKITTGTESIVAIDQDVTVINDNFKRGKYSYVQIEDFGCGIKFEDLHRIFEPFYTTNAEGRGLGLSVVYGFVVRHDGLVRTTSDLGKGTRIRVLLPETKLQLAAETEQESAPVNSKENPPKYNASKKRNLLVVDDNQSVLVAFSNLLEESPWNVVTAQGGGAALKILKKHPKKFHGIMLDIQMPRVGGEQVLKAMNKLKINVPVAIMSGYSLTRLETIQKDPLVKGILLKPFRAHDLMRVLNSAFLKSRKRNPR